MAAKSKAVDAYIAKANDFAKPILLRLREIVHAACPEVVEEMKWSSPHFAYKGMFCGMSAFKAHAMFGFWKHELVAAAVDKAGAAALEACGRLTSEEDLPSAKVLTACIKAGMRLNDEGVKVDKPKTKKAPFVVPDDLAAAIKKNKKAQQHFTSFSPSKQREYVEWITDAKTEETRLRRLETAVEWIAEGKSRNWKYEKC